VPWITGPLCPSCCDRVTPVRGQLRACRCGKTITGIKPDGGVHVSGPEGVELVPVCVPFREQLSLPGVR
jgi:hypothetical protein